MNAFLGIANAQTNTISYTFIQLLYNIEQAILNPLIFLLAGLALLLFLYGVFEFIKGADNEDARKKGGQHMLWGIIGMAIMFSVYGIINFILSTMGSIGGYNYGFYGFPI